MKKTLIKEIEITADKVVLKGNLSIPKNAKAIILFAHGSGSSRFSPRNQYVAQVLYKAGLATLLMDLLTKEEELIDEQTGEIRFNIEFLADRLIGATTWLKKNSEAKKLAVGYFGSSTGAGAALIAAAKYPADIKTIVSRGGRPDLAMPYLKKVKASVLLIVGGNDIPVIRMNKEAMKHLSIEKKLEIVPGATHLFEEPGKLEEVAKLAAGWFTKHM
ncbi:MAG TPA: dienelactone hydrolase family protein [Candidatus Woesearchaeota archaeon]|nr:dienelactone hydrolase family protein [Candidatus Woesearchaeota archaeon]